MKTANVVELKTRLGHYLRLVSGGETIVVTSHRHPVARLTRLDNGAESLPMAVPERPVSDVAMLTAVRLAKPVDAVGALLRDRERR